MNELLLVQKKLIPDILDKMYRRYIILSGIQKHQPIGRRNLSEYIDLSERILRTEIDYLKQLQLVVINKKGMSVSQEGIILLEDVEKNMSSYIEEMKKASIIEHFFGIKKVIVVSGNSDKDLKVKSEMGNETSLYLQDIINKDLGITVTGGSTMHYVANELKPFKHKVVFTPARGGLGEDVMYQANAIVNVMAEHSESTYETLYVPDQVSESAYAMLMNEPSVRVVLDHIKHADIVIHGIGDAIKMANRRSSDESVVKKLIDSKAVGEAFGYYLDQKGKIVHKVRTIGLQLEDLNKKKHIIAVAGGKSKVKAILSYLQIAPKDTVLITDEIVASEITKHIEKNVNQ